MGLLDAAKSTDPNNFSIFLELKLGFFLSLFDE